MKQSDIAQQLGSMIDQQTMSANNTSVDMNIPAELEEPAPVFEVDYNKEELEARAEAMETIECIVFSVVPECYQDDVMLKNKMKLDAKQLGMLYYLQITTNIAMRRTMDIIAGGSTDPKIFKNNNDYQKRLSDLSAQITDMQNDLRKYYIDTYLDLESKTKAEEVILPPNKSISMKSQRKIEDNSNSDMVVTDNGGVKFSGNKSAVQQMAALKKERLKKAAEEAVTF